jgi:hypothetical protein
MMTNAALPPESVLQEEQESPGGEVELKIETFMKRVKGVREDR